MSEVKRYWLPSSLLKDEAGWHQDDTCVVPDWAYDALAAQRDEGLAREAELVKNHRAHAARLLDERGVLKQRLAEAKALLQESLPALEQGATAFKAIRPIRAKVRDYLASPGCADVEPDFKSDQNAVYIFPKLMLHKLAKKAAEGRSGWQECSQARLTRMLREHVEKGDPVDVANFCMMLCANGMCIGPGCADGEQPS